MFDFLRSSKHFRPTVVAVAALLAGLGSFAIASQSGSKSVNVSAGDATTTSEATGQDATTTSSTANSTTTTALARTTTTAKPAVTPEPEHRGFGNEGWIAYVTAKELRLVAPDGTGDYALLPGLSAPSWSPDHTAIAASGTADGPPGIGWIGRDGRFHQVSDKSDSWPAWSADGSRILSAGFRRTQEKTLHSIRSVARDGSDARVLYESECYLNHPRSSPDGKLVGFLSLANCGSGDLGNAEFFVMNADGTGVRRVGSHSGIYSVDWSPDSETVVYAYSEDVWTVSIKTGARHQLTRGNPIENLPQFSPDGSMIAFTFDHGDGGGIEVMKLDGSNRRRVVNHFVYSLTW